MLDEMFIFIFLGVVALVFVFVSVVRIMRRVGRWGCRMSSDSDEFSVGAVLAVILGVWLCSDVLALPAGKRA